MQTASRSVWPVFVRGGLPGQLHLHRSRREHEPAYGFSGGERYAKVYNIDYNRCIFCGYCVEACPTDAITHGHGFELASYDTASLIVRKEQMLAPLPPGASGHVSAPPANLTKQAKNWPLTLTLARSF